MCGPGDAVGAGHDAVAGAGVCDGDEFFLSGGSAPYHFLPVVVDGGGLNCPCDAVGAGHDAVAGAGNCDSDEFFLSGGSAPGDRIPVVVGG